MSLPKVCILTSGRGTRMGPRSAKINKALLPLQKKAILSLIIEKFPTETPFVIALGHLGDQVRAYLKFAHPEKRFEFVTVDRIEGPGSGPGYSLKCCAPFLKEAFYFVACDTLWDDDSHINTGSDWVAVAPVAERDSESYCNFEIESGNVLRIADKERVSGPAYRAFIGLCFIKRVEAFWKGLGERDLVHGELQISSGLKEVLKGGALQARQLVWTDVGTEEGYRNALSRFEKFDFSKSDEYFYAVGDRIIKLFTNPSLAHQRFQRAIANPGVFPEMIGQHEGFLCYRRSPGDTLYRIDDHRLFPELLAWLRTHLWKPVPVEPARLRSACSRFYRLKTEERLAEYQKKAGLGANPLDRKLKVRGRELPSVRELLAEVPWNDLENGCPVFFHGDLQFDNVLYDAPSRQFKLIDWRQDFGGCTEFGDLYYDLAKLRGGILIDYHKVHAGEFGYRESGNEIEFEVPEVSPRDSYLDTLEKFARGAGLDSKKIRLLNGLIYLNMSPLHQPPFDQLVFAYGNLILNEELEN